MRTPRQVDRSSGGKSESSPFISISRGWRTVLIGYVLIYDLLVPAVSFLLHGVDQPLMGWRFITHVCYHLLLILPLIFYRPRFGWLHPLIFPVLFEFAKGVLKAPDQLLAPLSVLTEPVEWGVFHQALLGWGQRDLAIVAVETTLISILALVLYYCGFFFGPQLKSPSVLIRLPKKVASKALLLVGLSMVFFVAYMQAKGGVVAHLSSLAAGRHVATGAEGHIAAFMQVGMLATLVWYSVDSKASRNVFFWLALFVSLPVVFVTAGSRSAVVGSLVLFVIVWMLRHRRLPAFRVVAFGFASLVLIGVLGEFRQSLHGGVETEVLTSVNVEESLARAGAEIDRRREMQGPTAVVARVPESVELLYGESYLGVVFFFIPRAIWEAKPRGAGSLYAQHFLGAAADAKAVPIGPVGEAYWNFHIPGVMAVFFLFGVFHQWVARVFRRYGRNPVIWVPFVITVVEFSPTGPAAVPYFQKIILVCLILFLLGARITRQRAPG